METIKQCPFCGSTAGLYSKEIVKYEQYYGYDGEPIGCSDNYDMTRRKSTPLYCQDCNKKIGTYENMFMKGE